MDRRNTIQKELVLHAVQGMRSHVTAEEVYACIVREHPSVGKSTVYRNLAILAEERKIRKIDIPGAPDCYDFTTERHCHVQCVRCGTVADVETDGLLDPEKHILDAHGMTIFDCGVLFKGICSDCRKKEEENS